MRPIAVLLPFLMVGAAAAQTRCPTSAEGFSRPVEASAADWIYTDGPDRVLDYTLEPSAFAIDRLPAE